MIQERFLLTLNGGGKLKRDADARHLRDRLRLIFAVRINKRDGLRQFGFALVVVGNDQIDAKFPAQRRLLIGRNTAVNRYNQFHALFFEGIDRNRVQPVTLFEPGGDIAGHMAASAAQIFRQQTGRRDAVNVIIAENGDMLTTGQRLLDAGGSLIHVQKVKWRGKRGAAG